MELNCRNPLKSGQGFNLLYTFMPSNGYGRNPLKSGQGFNIGLYLGKMKGLLWQVVIPLNRVKVSTIKI